MVFNTTYTDKETEQLINDLVGKPFTLLKRFRMRGIGSKRLIISNVSPNLNYLLNKVSDINYANFELRPGGLLVHINKGLKTYTWAIPYRQLVIYKNNGLSIHAQGKFIQFKSAKALGDNKAFIKKILHQRMLFFSKQAAI